MRERRQRVPMALRRFFQKTLHGGVDLVEKVTRGPAILEQQRDGGGFFGLLQPEWPQLPVLVQPEVAPGKASDQAAVLFDIEVKRNRLALRPDARTQPVCKRKRR